MRVQIGHSQRWAMFAAVLFAVLFWSEGYQPTEASPLAAIVPEIPGVIAANTKIEVVKSGWHSSFRVAAMTDGGIVVSANGSVMRLGASGSWSSLVDKFRGEGIAIDSKDRVIGAQDDKRISVVYPHGSDMILADSFEGKPFIRPKDVVIDKKDGVYFSDVLSANAEGTPTALPESIYYVPANGKAIRVADDIRRPTGLALGPDWKTLYVNDWGGEYLIAYDIQPDGTLKNRRNHAKYEGTKPLQNGVGFTSGADGLCSDSLNDTYAATPIGLQVFNAKGEHMGNITIPLDMPPEGCAFAGPDNRYLYVVGHGVVFRIHTLL